MVNKRNDAEIKTKKQVVGATNPASLLLGQIEFGMSISKRLIYIEDTIDIYTGSFLEQRIFAIVETSKDSKTPITVKVSSYGGDVYGMFSTIDVIKNAPVKINTIGSGPVMSAAAFILAAGTGKRLVTKNTIVMIHMMSSWFGGTTSDIVAEVKHIQDLQSRLYGLLEQHSKKPINFWASNSKTNLYLPAEKCVEFGLADGII